MGIIKFLTYLKYFFDIVLKIHELHKAGIDKKVTDDIAESVKAVGDKIVHYHIHYCKKGGENVEAN